MESSVKYDLVNAKAKHYLFKSKMRAYLDGSTEVAEEVLADHTACVLGKWIKDIGKVKYGEFEEIKQLDQVHQRIHEKAQEIIKLKKTGKENQAQAKMYDIDIIGSEIIKQIEVLEERLS